MIKYDLPKIERIIEDYNKWHGPLLDGFLKYYNTLDLKKVIECVTVCKGSGPHSLLNPHYRRIKEIPLNEKQKELEDKIKSIKKCKSFNDLYKIVEEGELLGIGPLINYDISLAIGSKLDIYPEDLYLHSKTVLGTANVLGLEKNGNRVKSKDLKNIFKSMKPHHIENMMCIYHKAIEKK